MRNDRDAREIYAGKLTSPQRAVSQVRSGSAIALGMAMSQPPALLAALAERAQAGDVDALRVCVCITFMRRRFCARRCCAIR